MRLEQKREEEVSKRKGLTGRTIVMIIWLGISVAIAYFLTQYLQNEDMLNINNLMYNQIGLPRSVPEWGAQLLIIFAMVIVFQIIFWIGFIWFTPEGRRRTGDASMVSRNKDPFGDSDRY